MQRPIPTTWTTLDLAQPLFLDRDYLRKRASWIRDELDPLVAREGPDVLCPDIVLTLVTFFDELCRASIPTETLVYSRVPRALLEITGRATRWPGKLIDKVEHVIKHLEESHGSLEEMRPLLYEGEGRLNGISSPEDVEREKLLIKWLKTPGILVSPTVSRRHGDLGFKPGDWWINAMYAYRAGIIDNGNPLGGITSDGKGAYALLMTHHDEISGPGSLSCTYRCKSSDTGRYRLTSAYVEARQPLRLLRSHTLRSFWTPRAGVRYEGLYTVTGWTITYDEKACQWNYDVTLTRMPKQTAMTDVVRRPTAEEIDDYTEYKRIRGEVKAARNVLHRAWPIGGKGAGFLSAGAVTSHSHARHRSGQQSQHQHQQHHRHHHPHHQHQHHHHHHHHHHHQHQHQHQHQQVQIQHHGQRDHRRQQGGSESANSPDSPVVTPNGQPGDVNDETSLYVETRIGITPPLTPVLVPATPRSPRSEFPF
ncbi:hypothetical protein AAFC00_000233 [Neodothiora populina]|uniref:YDG domain-containing protein n=1 Tax=Neodothiora populina TaxID=2781224 RepID=A0ABR3P389_9PEZI